MLSYRFVISSPNFTCIGLKIFECYNRSVFFLFNCSKSSFLTDFMFILVQIWKGTINLLPLRLGFACSCIHSFKADRDISLWYCYKISSHRTQLFSHMQNKMAASQEVQGYTLVDIVVPPLYHVLSACKVSQCLHSQDGIMPWSRWVVQSKTTSKQILLWRQVTIIE